MHCCTCSTQIKIWRINLKFFATIAEIVIRKKVSLWLEPYMIIRTFLQNGTIDVHDRCCEIFVPYILKSHKASVVVFKTNLKVLTASTINDVIVREGHFRSMSSNSFAFFTARVTWSYPGDKRYFRQELSIICPHWGKWWKWCLNLAASSDTFLRTLMARKTLPTFCTFLLVWSWWWSGCQWWWRWYALMAMAQPRQELPEVLHPDDVSTRGFHQPGMFKAPEPEPI